VNFFAHASVALWRSDDPRFLLGAMLPDLTSMLGFGVPSSSDPLLHEGIQFHHTTDAAFHGAGRFVAMCSDGVRSMSAVGMRRGSARAIAHVGIELLLDGRMSADEHARAAYGSALRSAVEERWSERLGLASEEQRTKMHQGLARLEHAPIPEGYKDPAFVVDRLQAILARRPRLALVPGEAEIAAEYIRSADVSLAESWRELLEQVRSGLQLFGR
jgi:hypothetical protein